MNGLSRWLAVGLTLVVGLAGVVPVAAVQSVAGAGEVASAVVPVDSISGADRYETAVLIARAAYPAGARSLVVATGENWPDAVGGVSLAGAYDGPVLLCKPDSIPATVVECVRDLAPETVFVLGGQSAVSDSALTQLAAAGIAPDQIVRLAGRTRYVTAALVASATVAAADPVWEGHAYLANGRSFADALSVGPLCAATGDPIYLTEPGRDASVVASMSAAGVTQVTILGGLEAVSDAAERLVAATVGAGNVDRIAGVDRYDTATKIADYAYVHAGFTNARPGLATGADFADAITGGVLLGKGRDPLLLVPRWEITDRMGWWLYARHNSIQEYLVLGGPAAVPTRVRVEMQHALLAPVFSEVNAMAHVTYLAGLGARGAGGTAEHLAFDYIAGRLRSYGYTVSVQTVYLPGGAMSHNVIAERAGTADGVIVLGAHVDSKPPSPGGNDNGSGVGVVLELARILAQAPTVPTVRFIGFGAEEIGGPTADDHHFGSRQYVSGLSATQHARIHGMVSVDMVGYGSTFNIRSLRQGPQTVVNSLQAWGSFTGRPLYFLLDPSSTGWSDHEAFEFAGIPAAWLEWRVDPVYHTIGDTAAHVQPTRVRSTGRLMRSWVLGLTPETLTGLRP